MRTLAMALLAATCLTGGSSAALGQRGAEAPRTAVDRWIQEPTAIALTPAQTKTVDSLRAKFKEETARVDAESKTSADRMAAVGKTRERIVKYQELVRAILTPEQRSVFEKNIEAASVRRMPFEGL